jgi:hypothetical protein
LYKNSHNILLGSGKGAAMVACVAEKCSLIDSVVHDEETADYENMN